MTTLPPAVLALINATAGPSVLNMTAELASFDEEVSRRGGVSGGHWRFGGVATGSLPPKKKSIFDIISPTSPPPSTNFSLYILTHGHPLFTHFSTVPLPVKPPPPPYLPWELLSHLLGLNCCTT